MVSLTLISSLDASFFDPAIANVHVYSERVKFNDMLPDKELSYCLDIQNSSAKSLRTQRNKLNWQINNS